MKSVLKAYWPVVRKHLWLFIAMVFFMNFTILVKATYPFLLRDLLNGLMDNNQALVVKTLWMIGGMFVLINLIWLVFDPVIVFFEARALRDIDIRSFNAVQSQSMRFFESSFSGSLVTSARRFSGSFEGIVDIFVFQLGRSMFMIVLTLVVFAREDPLLAFAFSIWIPIYCLACFWFAKLRVKRDLIAAEKDSKVGGAFADSFSNQSAVKSFAKERDEQQRFNSVAEDCYRHRIWAWIFAMCMMRLQTLITTVFEALVILLLVYGWRKGFVTAADFVFFQTYVLMLMFQVWDIGPCLNRLFRNLANAKEMTELYNTKPEVKDAVGARSLVVERGDIEFHAVEFNYVERSNREHDDIGNFTLGIRSGETLALVGHSGAGKSTLVKLLLRYYDLNSGYIRIDNQDIANVTQLSLRQQIAFVPQDPSLFHRSIKDNISFARPDATDEEIIEAARRARAMEFISQLPEGLNTLVGERGVKLSGGERQRIALARAFLVDAPILVLDEATSALDSETEHQIQSAIADLLEGRTCIVIAHRLSTIRRANRIVVMESGSIKEQGSHEDLLMQKGIYANLWRHQSGGYIK